MLKTMASPAQYPHEMLAAYPETICESAARLLFMNVKWMKTVTALTVLPMRDQVGVAFWHPAGLPETCRGTGRIDPTLFLSLPASAKPPVAFRFRFAG